MSTKKLKAISAAMLVFLAGCQHAPVATSSSPYERWMSRAEANIRAQNVHEAKSDFQQAASADASAKEPWVRLADLDFNARDYGRAAAESQEVLKRDPSDANAQSILTISGIRIAVDALDFIQRESDPKGPAHQEALLLVKKLRETLGPEALLPPKKKKKALRTSSSPGADIPRGAVVTHGLPDSSDPFSSLRTTQ